MRLERSVFPGEGLAEELFQEFDAYVRERAHAMLSDIDDWLAAAARRPIKSPKARIATGVSVYHYVAPTDARILPEEYVIPSESVA